MPKHTPRASPRRVPGGPAQPSHFARSAALLLLVAGLSGPWLPSALAQGAPAYGVAVTPQNFPEFTAEDVDKAFVLAKQVGDYQEAGGRIPPAAGRGRAHQLSGILP